MQTNEINLNLITVLLCSPFGPHSGYKDVESRSGGPTGTYTLIPIAEILLIAWKEFPDSVVSTLCSNRLSNAQYFQARGRVTC